MQGKGWTPAIDIKEDDDVASRQGDMLILSNTLVEKSAQVFNFSVYRTHSYFVGEAGLWVHNTFCDIDTAKKFKDALDATPRDEKVGFIQQVMSGIAKKLGWKKRADISRKNPNYEVYELPDGTFMSVDRLHGLLEKQNKRGKHLGEFDIDGKQTGPADNKGNHDINV